jgi:hypothetical protein
MRVNIELGKMKENHDNEHSIHEYHNFMLKEALITMTLWLMLMLLTLIVVDAKKMLLTTFFATE